MDITKMPKVEMRKLDDLREYENNARKITKKAVDYVAQRSRNRALVGKRAILYGGDGI